LENISGQFTEGTSELTSASCQQHLSISLESAVTDEHEMARKYCVNKKAQPRL